MRKVYQNEKSVAGLAMAIMAAVGVTGVLFGILPFTHIIAHPSRSLELRKTSATDLPPPVEPEAPPPPPEAEKPPEAPPEPKLADAPQQILPSADLEAVTGAGGGLKGFADDMRSLAKSETTKDDGIIGGDELEKRPEPMSTVSPTYPSDLRKQKVEGRVTLLCLVTAEGRVEDVRVENSSRPEFEKPAVEAMRKWRFRPGMKDGQAVSTYLRYPISFRITK